MKQFFLGLAVGVTVAGTYYSFQVFPSWKAAQDIRYQEDLQEEKNLCRRLQNVYEDLIPDTCDSNGENCCLKEGHDPRYYHSLKACPSKS